MVSCTYTISSLIASSTSSMPVLSIIYNYELSLKTFIIKSNKKSTLYIDLDFNFILFNFCKIVAIILVNSCCEFDLATCFVRYITVNTSFGYKIFLIAHEVNEKLLSNFYARNTGTSWLIPYPIFNLTVNTVSSGFSDSWKEIDIHLI